ncbi:alpha/beta fold hydrolase [Reyranella sp.]|uniref:alpha/beta fold hydrolase n=1 Tax=Reyranella sp. TaxID=1929291 RepID=UPI003BACFE65
MADPAAIAAEPAVLSVVPMADSIHMHRIDTGRITLNVREIGNGPVAIFLHGITSNSAVWDPQLLALKDTLRCVAVDQRGHGLSDKPEAGYDAKDFAADLVALIKVLNAGPAFIIGHSLGARNAVEAAVMAPDLVRGVVAIDFTPYIETEVLDQLSARVNGGDRLFASQQDIEEYLQNRYPLMPPEAVSLRAASAYRTVEGGFRPLASPQAMAQTAEGLRGDLVPTFKSVSRPILIVRGALSKLVSATALEKTRALRPDLPVLVVDNVDHYVNEEAPEVMTTAIRDFTSRH